MTTGTAEEEPNVPTFELTVANVTVVVEPVVPDPETSPSRVIAPEIEAVEAEVILPLPSTVIIGTSVEEPNDPTVVLTVAKLTAPDDTEKSPDAKDAIPRSELVATSAEIVIVLLLTAVSIPVPPVKVRVSVPNETESVVPLSAAIESAVEMEAVVTPVTKPLAFTVTTGIEVAEPNVPTFELTVANVKTADTSAVPSTPANAAVASPVSDNSLGVVHLAAESEEPVIVALIVPVTVRLPITSTCPVPFGSSIILPLVFVELIVLPFIS